jgi:osmoprotectant transport system substrate-binding protein
MRRTAALGVLAALAIGACGDSKPAVDTPAPDRTPIRIGTKNFTEQFILGELYSRALKAKGFDVQLKGNIGSTEIAHRALAAESLDMYPEYIGVLLSVIASVTDPPRSAPAAYKLAKDFEQRRDYTLLRSTPFSNANALAVKPAFARRHRVHSIADLKRLKRRVRLAALPEFRNRYEGMKGLRARYGLRNLRMLPLKGSDQRYPTLDSGKADVTLAFTTDGQLATSRYVQLSDPRGLFASGHLAPIISSKVLKAHGPGLAKAIDAVTAKLTTVAMRMMNKAVDIDKRTPAEVAEEFLRTQGLVK